MKSTTNEPNTQSLEQLKLIANAHVADYQVIATRISRFISLQSVPWPVLAAFLTVVYYTRSFLDPVLVAWGTAGVAQVAVLTYYFALYEVYNHVRYIENELKPNMAKILSLSPDQFWAYEKYLKKTGKANNPLYGDIGPALISFVAVALAALARIPGSGLDYIGSILNGLLLVMTITSVIRVVKVRMDFSA